VRLGATLVGQMSHSRAKRREKRIGRIGNVVRLNDNVCSVQRKKLKEKSGDGEAVTPNIFQWTSKRKSENWVSPSGEKGGMHNLKKADVTGHLQIKKVKNSKV